MEAIKFESLKRRQRVAVLEDGASRKRVFEVVSVSPAKETVKFRDGGGNEFVIPADDLTFFKVESDTKLSTPRGNAARYQVEALVRENMKANKQKSRKEMIEQIMAKVGMTKAGASTYYFNATQKLKKLN